MFHLKITKWLKTLSLSFKSYLRTKPWPIVIRIRYLICWSSHSRILPQKRLSSHTLLTQIIWLIQWITLESASDSKLITLLSLTTTWSSFLMTRLYLVAMERVFPTSLIQHGVLVLQRLTLMHTDSTLRTDFPCCRTSWLTTYWREQLEKETLRSPSWLLPLLQLTSSWMPFTRSSRASCLSWCYLCTYRSSTQPLERWSKRKRTEFVKAWKSWD